MMMRSCIERVRALFNPPLNQAWQRHMEKIRPAEIDDLGAILTIYNSVQLPYEFYYNLKAKSGRKPNLLWGRGGFICPPNIKDLEQMLKKGKGVAAVAKMKSGEIAGYTGVITDPNVLTEIYGEWFNYAPDTPYSQENLPNKTSSDKNIIWINKGIAVQFLNNATETAASVEMAVSPKVTWRRTGLATALKAHVYEGIKNKKIVVRYAEIQSIDNVPLSSTNWASEQFTKARGGEEFAIFYEHIELQFPGHPVVQLIVAWHCCLVDREEMLSIIGASQRS